MYLVLILCVSSVHGWYENCEVASEYCCNNTVDDGLREAERGYAKNLTSLMDPGEGCRWIFKSEDMETECCYSAQPEYLCRWKTHDKEKCRKNHTGFIVYPIYKWRYCTLQLFDVDYKDAGYYTQTTNTFNFTITLAVTRNRDWEVPVGSVFSSIAAALVLVALVVAGWMLRKWWNRKKEKECRAMLQALRDGNEASFDIHSKRVDVLGVKDEDGHNLLHLIGMLYWSEKMTAIIYACCEKKKLVGQRMNDEGQILLERTDKTETIISVCSTKHNLNAKNSKGETPLHIAAKYGKVKVVELLLANEKVDVNAADKNDWTPLHHAAFKGHNEVIRKLFRRQNVDIEANKALLWAALGGKFEAFTILFEHGAKLNAKVGEGRNILHIVAEKANANENEGRMEILNSILKQEEQQSLQTLFHAICFDKKQDSEAAKSSSFFGTPLEIAVKSGFIRAAELLIENGADFKTKKDQNNQEKHLHLILHAVLKGNKQFADFLLSKDPSLLNIRTENNETYLHLAVDQLNLNAVILLLNMKMDKQAKNCEGQTPLEKAEEKRSILSNEESKQKDKDMKLLSSIISELSKERDDIDKVNILNNIQKYNKERKKKEQEIKEIQEEKENQIEDCVKQLKDIIKKEKSWKKALKEYEREPEKEEKDPEDTKRENPTMEKIQIRVNEMIKADKKLPVAQMAQVLKMLNDEEISQANPSNRLIRRKTTPISLNL